MFNFIQNLFNRTPKNLYQRLGSEKGIKQLVANFYQVMENDSFALDCLHLHELEDGHITQETKDKLFMFLSGWLGGPPLFMEKIGPPRMRMRHAHLNIGEKEAEQWLYCMNKALDQHKLKESDRVQLMNSFAALAMRIAIK